MGVKSNFRKIELGGIFSLVDLCLTLIRNRKFLSNTSIPNPSYAMTQAIEREMISLTLYFKPSRDEEIRKDKSVLNIYFIRMGPTQTGYH